MYNISVSSPAERQLNKLPKKTASKIIQAIEELANSPRPQGCKKLKGQSEDFYRIRVGDYRVVYVVRDKELLVLVVRIGHRREVYR